MVAGRLDTKAPEASAQRRRSAAIRGYDLVNEKESLNFIFGTFVGLHLRFVATARK